MIRTTARALRRLMREAIGSDIVECPPEVAALIARFASVMGLEFLVDNPSGVISVAMMTGEKFDYHAQVGSGYMITDGEPVL